MRPIQDFASLREAIAPAKAEKQGVPDKREVQQKNEEAMAALQGMLSGVHGAPKGRRRRTR